MILKEFLSEFVVSEEIIQNADNSDGANFNVIPVHHKLIHCKLEKVLAFTKWKVFQRAYKSFSDISKQLNKFLMIILIWSLATAFASLVWNLCYFFGNKTKYFCVDEIIVKIIILTCGDICQKVKQSFKILDRFKITAFYLLKLTHHFCCDLFLLDLLEAAIWIESQINESFDQKDFLFCF